MKVLIIAACLVNFGDDRGGQHIDHAEISDVPIDTARKLVSTGRALYIDKKDDPSKGGINTASTDMLKAAETMRKQRVAATKSAAATPAAAAGADASADPNAGK